jgi:hypothetical protein
LELSEALVSAASWVALLLSGISAFALTSVTTAPCSDSSTPKHLSDLVLLHPTAVALVHPHHSSSKNNGGLFPSFLASKFDFFNSKLSFTVVRVNCEKTDLIVPWQKALHKTQMSYISLVPKAHSACRCRNKFVILWYHSPITSRLAVLAMGVWGLQLPSFWAVESYLTKFFLCLSLL